MIKLDWNTALKEAVDRKKPKINADRTCWSQCVKSSGHFYAQDFCFNNFHVEIHVELLITCLLVGFRQQI